MGGRMRSVRGSGKGAGVVPPAQSGLSSRTAGTRFLAEEGLNRCPRPEIHPSEGGDPLSNEFTVRHPARASDRRIGA